MAESKAKEIGYVDDPQSEYDCPVCFELILPPILQCCNGHLICGACIEPLKVCPICRDSLPEKKIRNLAVEKIVREMKRPCPFNKKGCTEALTIANGFEDHKLSCSYAPSNFCQLLGLDCDKKLSRVDLFQHYVSKDHGPHFKAASGKEIHVSQSNFEAPRSWQQQRVALIQTLEQTFVLKCREDTREKTISWTVFLLGTKQIATNFEVSIKINPTDPSAINNGLTKNTMLKWRGPISNISSQENNSIKLPDIFSISYKHFPSLFTPNAANENFVKWEIRLKICNVHKGMNKLSYLTGGPLVFHQGVYCSGCRDNTLLTGPRYKCIECDSYDLCGNCMRKKVHSHHLFVTIPHPSMAPQLQRAMSIIR